MLNYGRPKGQNYEHTQLSPVIVNTMKVIRNAHKRHSNHAQISRTTHTQVEMSHTQYEPLTHKSKCHTQKVELPSWGVWQISMLIYLGRQNLHIFPHFVYGGRIK